MGSIERRIEDLERRLGGADRIDQTSVAKREFALRVERGFEKSLQYARTRLESSAEDVSISEMEGASPQTIAAYYAVLASRADPRAEEVRTLYEEKRERRRQHPASVELEEISPGTAEAFDSFFWQMIERHAQTPPE